MNRVVFSSLSPHWSTPQGIYDALDAEFHFTLDPCPLGGRSGIDGTMRTWSGEVVYCNPPYGNGIPHWLEKAKEATVSVFLLPVRSDTRWWHDYVMQANEIRFIRGRLRFNGARYNAPFPSCVVVFRQERA